MTLIDHVVPFVPFIYELYSGDSVALPSTLSQAVQPNVLAVPALTNATSTAASSTPSVAPGHVVRSHHPAPQKQPLRLQRPQPQRHVHQPTVVVRPAPPAMPTGTPLGLSHAVTVLLPITARSRPATQVFRL